MVEVGDRITYEGAELIVETLNPPADYLKRKKTFRACKIVFTEYPHHKIFGFKISHEDFIEEEKEGEIKRAGGGETKPPQNCLNLILNELTPKIKKRWSIIDLENSLDEYFFVSEDSLGNYSELGIEEYEKLCIFIKGELNNLMAKIKLDDIN